ncbi:MAG TPA: hypothetical protein VJ720_13400 [Chitinophaga sp.]|nr:hypothetical protein [Chitinophaga sp.]
MACGWKFHMKDAANMIDKLPAVQKFLLFLTKNFSAILILLLAGSVAANVYLVKEILLISTENDGFKNATIEYERRRGEKLEEILRQEIQRDIIKKQKNDE